MKICWDNLEKLKYKNGYWYDKYYTKYIYKDSCKNCKEPFLINERNKGIFCTHKCSKTGKFHHFFGKKNINQSKRMIKYNPHKSDKIKKKHSKNIKGSKNPNWKGGVKGKIPLYDTYAPQISFCENVRRNKKDPNILEVKCAYCGKWFIPKLSEVNNRIECLNGKIKGEMRFYCSTQCKKECPIYGQVLYPKGFKPATSREVQPELRQMCFERDNYTCQKCGKIQEELKVGLHCHHIEGIRWNPLESADLDKVITVCKNCHIKIHKQTDCNYYDLKCK